LKGIVVNRSTEDALNARGGIRGGIINGWEFEITIDIVEGLGKELGMLILLLKEVVRMSVVKATGVPSVV